MSLGTASCFVYNNHPIPLRTLLYDVVVATVDFTSRRHSFRGFYHLVVSDNELLS